MKQNHLLTCGSALAVVVLVLASLSPVVGYTSLDSFLDESPLFTVRINSANDKENDNLRCDYVGKGTKMQFPTRNNYIIAMLQKLVEGINQMDDAKFNTFIDFITKQLNNNNKLKDVSIEEIGTNLYHLKNNPELLINYVPKVEDDDTPTIGNWRPFCFLQQMIAMMIIIIAFTWNLIKPIVVKLT